MSCFVLSCTPPPPHLTTGSPLAAVAFPLGQSPPDWFLDSWAWQLGLHSAAMWAAAAFSPALCHWGGGGVGVEEFSISLFYGEMVSPSYSAMWLREVAGFSLSLCYAGNDGIFPALHCDMRGPAGFSTSLWYVGTAVFSTSLWYVGTAVFSTSLWYVRTAGFSTSLWVYDMGEQRGIFQQKLAECLVLLLGFSSPHSFLCFMPEYLRINASRCIVIKKRTASRD